MNKAVIEVSNLKKIYGGVPAINGISFRVQKGEIFGLLGPNGAGKTTTMECLEGIRQPDAGTVDIMGTDALKQPAKLRSLIGVQLQSSALPATIRVDEAMKFFCAYHRVATRLDLLERLGLAEKMRAKYETLSTGQKRRLALALAVAHRPAVVFLDEPTAGLDVATRVELHHLMKELRDEGTTLILSSHDMAEVEAMADRVAILLRGSIVTTGSPRELTAMGAGLTKVTVHAAGTDLAKAVIPAIVKRTQQDEYLTYYTSDTGPAVSAIIGHIGKSGGTLLDLRVERPSLEERFLELTREEAC
jgi:ABC-2 type transport system ATP-binding protein